MASEMWFCVSALAWMVVGIWAWKGPYRNDFSEYVLMAVVGVPLAVVAVTIGLVILFCDKMRGAKP